MKFSYFLLIALTFPFAIPAMENHKALVERIKTAQTNYATDTFATTFILKFQNNTMVLKGDVKTLDEQDEKEILAGNYIKDANFALIPTRFTPKISAFVAAIIIGTQDPQKAKQVPFSVLNEIVKIANKASL